MSVELKVVPSVFISGQFKLTGVVLTLEKSPIYWYTGIGNLPQVGFTIKR